MHFISPLIEPMVSLLLNPVKRHIGYLVKARTNVQNVANYLEKLRASWDDLEKEIEDVKSQQKQSTEESTEEVNLWLERVRKVEDQVVTTKSKYNNRGCCLFGDSSLDCWLAYKYRKKATELLEEIVQFGPERNVLPAIATVQSPVLGQAMLTESTLLGLDRCCEMVQSHLIDDIMGVIGIHGMGGVGKITLLKKVNNSLLEGDIGI